jgi:hypothetical protein
MRKRREGHAEATKSCGTDLQHDRSVGHRAKNYTFPVRAAADAELVHAGSLANKDAAAGRVVEQNGCSGCTVADFAPVTF